MKLTTLILYPIAGTFVINFIFDVPHTHALFYSAVLTIIWALYNLFEEKNEIQYRKQLDTLLEENDLLTSENHSLATKVLDLENETTTQIDTIYHLQKQINKDAETINVLQNGEYIKNANWEVERVGNEYKELSIKFESEILLHNQTKGLALEREAEIKQLKDVVKSLSIELEACKVVVDKVNKANESRANKQKQNATIKKQNISNIV